MKARRLAISILLSLSSIVAMADEGMWMVNSISEALARKMQESGLKLQAGEIYDADKVWS